MSTLPDLRAYESMLVFSMVPLAGVNRAALKAAQSFRAYEEKRAAALTSLIMTGSADSDAAAPPPPPHTILVDVGAGVQVAATTVTDASTRCVLFDIGPRRQVMGGEEEEAQVVLYPGERPVNFSLFLEIPPREALARARAAAAEATSAEAIAEHTLAAIASDIVGTLDALAALRSLSGGG